MKAILLIDHGSRRAAANHMLSCMAAVVQEMAGEHAVVRYAHMELAEPSIARGFADCVAAGADDVIAFPYMLSPGRHATADIPRLVGEAASAYPGTTYRVTPAFGVHEMLAAVVLSRAGIPAVREPAREGGACPGGITGGITGVCEDGCPGAERTGAVETGTKERAR